MSFLEPVIQLVGRLSFRNKLRATALVFGAPLVLAAAVLLYGLNTRVNVLSLEREALAVQVPAHALLANLYQFTAAQSTAALLANEPGAEARNEYAEAKKRDATNALNTAKTAFAGSATRLFAKGEPPQWLGNWDALQQSISNGKVDELQEILPTLRADLDRLNEHTGLLNDGDAASSRLLDIMTTHLPGLIDSTGKAAQIGSVTLINKSLRGSKRIELTLLRGNLNAYVQWSIDGLQKVSHDHAGMAPDLDSASSQLNTAFLSLQEALTTKMLETADFDMSPAALLDITAKSFTETLAVSVALERKADLLVADRLAMLETQRNVVLVIMAIGVILLASGFIAAYISIMRGLDGLSTAVNTMAQGDLGARVAITTRDELGDVGTQFNSMAEKLAESKARLQEKTNDIHSMLQNMPQGILTIVDGGKIHSEYSSYLEAIFETKEIAGQSAMSFVFGNGSVSSDVISQIDATISACIGEDRMNYDMNAHLLTSEVFTTMPDGRVKCLELNWSPICNDDDAVEKIMLCIRDQTELRQLEAEARHQKLELEMIGQILKVNQEKFHEFVESARTFIAANNALLNQPGKASPDLVNQLFRNMHTIKGNARTYGLLRLTNMVHEAEQAYDALRKDASAVFDRNVLLLQLDAVAGMLEEYATLNEVSLGRKGPGRRGSAEKYLLVEREQVDSMIANLEAYDLHGAEQQTLAAAVAQIKSDLRLFGTEPVMKVLDGVFQSLPSLAKELGKEPPRLVVADSGIHIRKQAGDLLRNVFMHLYRNSMDHGLETAAERAARDKPAAGTITLTIEKSDGRVKFHLSDDGKGLALDHIRRKGQEKGLISHSNGDEEVAGLIFAAGFSTAATVTEVSGRGVGMDAVQNFIKEAGGSIEMRFTDERTGADFRRFETIVSLPDHIAVTTQKPQLNHETTAPHHHPAAERGHHEHSLVASLLSISGKLAPT